MTDRKFMIHCENPAAQADIRLVSGENGIEVYKVRVSFSKKMNPAPVRIAWEEEMVDHLHTWYPLAAEGHRMHQWFIPNKVESRFHFGAPLLATIGDGGKNKRTVATSDPITASSLTFCIKDIDQKNKVEYAWKLFDGACDDLEEYEAYLRIDSRNLPFSDTVQEVYPWWAEMGWEIPAPPQAAEDALYSTWYNFHQAPEADRLLADLKIAAELGFKTVILDDGWQFAGPSSGDYALCGAWEMSKEKFADFKAFCKEVHKLGMKLLVWFAVPFIGIDSPLFETYKDKFIYVDAGFLKQGTLDPRYPEVREYIISNYRRFLTEYDIDGFKLDFIDSFANGTAPAYNPETMDCETTGEATRKLLMEIDEELSKIKPELLYEYRQNYIGPAINRFGNMLRVCDCAYEAHRNRIGIVDLRLLGYPVAVHADMLFWAPEEPVKLCARQLLNILFGVPQISVILAESTEKQKELLRAYLAYWTKNRPLLLHGKFSAYSPEQNFTRISAEDEERTIEVLYSDMPYTWQGKTCEIHHNGMTEGLIFENPTDKTLHAEIFECFGTKKIGCAEIPPHAILRLPVPVTGMASVRA